MNALSATHRQLVARGDPADAVVASLVHADDVVAGAELVASVRLYHRRDVNQEFFEVLENGRRNGIEDVAVGIVDLTQGAEIEVVPGLDVRLVAFQQLSDLSVFRAHRVPMTIE